jgi:hypothetical protein
LRDRGSLLDCADIAGQARVGLVRETMLGLFEGRDRRRVAVAVTSDGRRAQVPLDGPGLTDVSLLGIIRSLLVGLDGLLGLITGSRRENRGTRKDERR